MLSDGSWQSCEAQERYFAVFAVDVFPCERGVGHGGFLLGGVGHVVGASTHGLGRLGGGSAVVGKSFALLRIW